MLRAEVFGDDMTVHFIAPCMEGIWDFDCFVQFGQRGRVLDVQSDLERGRVEGFWEKKVEG